VSFFTGNVDVGQSYARLDQSATQATVTLGEQYLSDCLPTNVMFVTFHGQRPFSRFWTRPVLKLMRRNGQTNPSRDAGHVSRPVW